MAAPQHRRIAMTIHRIVFAFAGAMVVLAGCGGGGPSPAQPTGGKDLESVMVKPVSTPVERKLDGVIEAVNQGTVAAQTSGRVSAILYDVNDFVPAGAL